MERPIRTLTLNFDEGQDVGALRSAYEIGSDGITFDLEDHVPRSQLSTARANIRTILDEERARDVPTFVRVNEIDDPEILADLEAIVCQGLYAVMLPKVRRPSDISSLAYLLDLFEARAGIEPGHTKILPLLETAQGNREAFEIAEASPRVAYMGATLNQNGDPARSIGYQWTRTMEETLYIRQKVLLDVRSSHVRYPITGLWNPMDDLEGLEAFAVSSRQIGYFGMLVIAAPSHIELVNRVFTPAQDEIDYWAEVVEMMEAVTNTQVVPDVFVGRTLIPANRVKWGRLRLQLGSQLGVFPSANRKTMKPDSVGDLSRRQRELDGNRAADIEEASGQLP